MYPHHGTPVSNLLIYVRRASLGVQGGPRRWGRLDGRRVPEQKHCVRVRRALPLDPLRVQRRAVLADFTRIRKVPESVGSLSGGRAYLPR